MKRVSEKDSLPLLFTGLAFGNFSIYVVNSMDGSGDKNHKIDIHVKEEEKKEIYIAPWGIHKLSLSNLRNIYLYELWAFWGGSLDGWRWNKLTQE